MIEALASARPNSAITPAIGVAATIGLIVATSEASLRLLPAGTPPLVLAALLGLAGWAALGWALTALRQARRKAALLARNSRDIIAHLDTEGRFAYVSPASLPRLGYPASVLRGRPLPDLCHPDDVPAMQALLSSRPPSPGLIERVWRLRHASGHYVPVEICVGDAIAAGPVLVLRDVTRWQRAQAIQQESEARYRLLAENAGDMIVLARANRTRAYVSPSSHSLLGYAPEELCELDFTPAVHPDDRARVESTYDAFCRSGGQATCSYRLRHKDGHYVWVEATWVARASETSHGENEVIAVVRDISAHKAAEARIAFMARHDRLTGLANRELLRERAEDALRRVGRGEVLAVLCLDLDKFKTINDALGHAAGDALLRNVADRLQACVRETDTVARLGGDEFAVLQVDIERPEDASQVAERILNTLPQEYQIDGHAVEITASIGIAIAPPDGTAYEALLQKADIALYRAKREGGGTFRFFESEMNSRRIAREELERDLRKAITAREFEPYYMPLVSLSDGRVTGFEALLRWRHPRRGMVLPGEFIPIAEETGLIMQIGAWVLERACAQAASWPGPVTLAVNLSPVQLRSSSLLRTVSEALRKSGLHPSRLELEITESVLLEDNEATLAVLHDLRGLGVRIAMDDFGTGYSSLGYLRHFPFDKIKLDKSFVRDLADGAGAIAIVRAVAGLGRSLGITTLAEGVETREHFERLRAEGYAEAQGFYFSPPAPFETVTALLRHPSWRLTELAAAQ